MKINSFNQNSNIPTVIWKFFFKFFDNTISTFIIFNPIKNGYSIMTIIGLAIISNYGIAQAQVTPVVLPNGGFEIDGNLRSNDPTIGAGDWILGADGTGGYL